MEIKNIMSRDLVVGKKDNTIGEIAILMKENDIGFIPIADNKQIIGVITDRDIVINIVANQEKNIKIKTYLQNRLVSIDANKNIDEALEYMAKEKVKRLLVTEDRKLVGIISLSDLLSFINPNQLIKTLQSIYTINRNTLTDDTEIDEFYL